MLQCERCGDFRLVLAQGQYDNHGKLAMLRLCKGCHKIRRSV